MYLFIFVRRPPCRAARPAPNQSLPELAGGHLNSTSRPILTTAWPIVERLIPGGSVPSQAGEVANQVRSSIQQRPDVGQGMSDSKLRPAFHGIAHIPDMLEVANVCGRGCGGGSAALPERTARAVLGHGE